jgi:acylphosphatase
MPPKTDDAQCRAVVKGRVQGVGFRYFIQRQAADLGLTGWVRNLANGDVEFLARGPKDAVAQLLSRANEGPALAWVQHVAANWQPPDPNLKGFRVRETGW